MSKHSFTVESDTHCTDCNKPLKQNLVDKSPTATRCYCCHRVVNGKETRINKFGVTTINYVSVQAKNRIEYKYKINQK